MRTCSLFVLLGALAVSGCNTTNSVSPPLKVAISGKPLKMDIYYSINPDCTSVGSTTIRLIEQPKHGRVP
jgi:outer membrane protein assembly factor BamE (lipoprotein component of BamABCDE complex)